ncbi:hypothetical protein GCM10011360_37470 [Primorskyibacter flagellatus]|uniref:Uncharacterized protein n=1 Tax=Primorskyibacter flagellatus TaxID=1387277 RepID=A0A917EK09_9RHOB|nr:hypothetical protein [Primorskyibacter flagellatus]GGE46737.1 hypothetical protein GCM10011360_37470 [Primorskyibacter flagellatus]
MATPTRTSGEAGSVDNADQLREQIDRGGAGDKVAFSDPSAAPLGTDDEAAGHPPGPDEVRRAATAELPRDTPAADKQTPAERVRASRGVWVVAVAVGVLIAIGTGVAAFLP